MEEKKYLPIGSVVLTKKFAKKAMIIGYKIKTLNGTNEVFDYVGCVYPEGLIDSNKYLAFNQVDIDKILNVGYSDMQYEKYMDLMKKLENETFKN